jgi:uncharacterized circularly permuted ATP-grasp superfamily protein
VADDPVAAYHRLLEADPTGAAEQARRLQEAFAARDVTFGGAPMRSFLRPHLLDRRAWDALRADGRALLELAARAARRVFDGDVARLLDYLGTPPAEARWVALDPGPPDVVLSRLDAFLTPSGPRFLEINSDAPAGFGYGDRMAEVFQELPVFRAFAAGRRVSYAPSAGALVAAVRTAAAAAGPLRRVAIVDWADVKTRADQEILGERFRAEGLDCLLADPRDAALRDGKLHFGGPPVDAVYRRAVLGELVAREDEVRAFLEAYRRGAAAFVNTFRCHLSEDKAFFAILTDEAFAPLFTAEERALVARVVPWTRRMAERRTTRGGREIDLVPHVVAQKDALVLKPAHGYGGRAVLVGDETPAAEWERAVALSLREPWVVQERVPVPEEPFPVFDDAGRLGFESLKVNANPFYVAGADVGAVTRASRSAVINVSAGGGSVPTFVLG